MVAVIVPRRKKFGVGAGNFNVKNVKQFLKPFRLIEIGIIETSDAQAEIS